MILPPTWSVATYPGSPPVAIAYRRCQVRDRLELARWDQAWTAGMAAGLLTADLDAEHKAAACEAMAARLMVWDHEKGWAAGAPAGPVGIDTLPDPLWGWLYGLLYAPALQPDRLAGLASALALVPGKGVPGDPAATDCQTCLTTVHEEWRPERGLRGRPTSQPYPRARTLGDGICQCCARWDQVAGCARPGLGAHDLAIAELAMICQRTGALPDAGGILDQDADTRERVELVSSSPWFHEWSGNAGRAQAWAAASTIPEPLKPATLAEAGC